jgi:hypothetical protein
MPTKTLSPPLALAGQMPSVSRLAAGDNDHERHAEAGVLGDGTFAVHGRDGRVRRRDADVAGGIHDVRNATVEPVVPRRHRRWRRSTSRWSSCSQVFAICAAR